jgi:transcriptional regulator with XRE-family HTH domain
MNTDRQGFGMEQTFGSFLREKRTERMIKLNTFAALVGISGVYQSYIETGKRPAPREHILERIAKVLALDKYESETMYTLAALTHAKKSLPNDLGAYILERPYVAETLMIAKENDIPEEEWRDFKNKISLM